MDNLTHLRHHKTIREEARRWVVLFNGDEQPTQEQIRAMQEWAGLSPVHLQELERAEARWEDTNQLTELAVPLCVRCKSLRPRRLGWGLDFLSARSGLASASAIVLTITIGLFVTVWQPDSVGNGIYGTAVGELRTLSLEDGSTLQLDTNSQAQVSFNQHSRQIRLIQGKAHFDVTKNPDRPFEVAAAEGLVRAVGTAFSVQVNGDSIEVLVDEGRVDLARIEPLSSASATGHLPEKDSSDSVSSQAPSKSKQHVFRSLDRGHAALFDSHTEAFTILAEKELQREQSWRTGALIFAGEPLEQVVSEVSRYTSATIEISDPLLSELQVGGRFNIGDIDALFEVLETAFSVQVIAVSENHFQLHLSSQ